MVDQTKKDFEEGVIKFLLNINLCKHQLIKKCKNKYPHLNGRCVNLIYFDIREVGITWQSNFVIDPGRIALDKDRVKLALSSSSYDNSKIEDQIIERINTYNPNKNLLFWFVASGEDRTLQSFDEI